MVEKETYRKWVQKSVKELEDTTQPTHIRNTHYTFDFANPLTLPHHARQVGQIYFTTPLKVQMFGIDGKLTHDPNAVISMLHCAIEKCGLGEEEFGIHADICAGQNKNRYVLAYFCWRIITGRSRMIHYMLQIPGHTRCLIDACFGNVKRLYRRSDCVTQFTILLTSWRNHLLQIHHYYFPMNLHGNGGIGSPFWEQDSVLYVALQSISVFSIPSISTRCCNRKKEVGRYCRGSTQSLERTYW